MYTTVLIFLLLLLHFVLLFLLPMYRYISTRVVFAETEDEKFMIIKRYIV